MKNELNLSPAEVDGIFTPQAVRKGAEKAFRFTEEGKGKFLYHPEQLEQCVDTVLTVIRKNYPDLKIPFHSRWGHFRAGGVDRGAELDQKLAALDPKERARVKLDLVIPSVLLDAGAGADWKFTENGKFYSRSEGLGVASYHLFLSGAFSSDGQRARSESEGLKNFSRAELEKGFQVSSGNPLLGVDGRVLLINNLGRAVGMSPVFPGGRPGNILDYLAGKHGSSIPASAVLKAVLEGMGSIWPGRLSAAGRNLGDVWLHPSLGLLPFHKLSQWMTYSLIEPMEEAGFPVTGVEELTGLAEYRNGGLMLDSGLLSLRDPSWAAQAWEPGSELIVEWRALTVYLLDRIGELVQKRLGKSPQEFPLARVLEGGTWWAGRFLAQEKRGGNPPLQIMSDGTVF